MKQYHIWTIGCQMNVADSGRVAAELDALGFTPTGDPKAADVIILNTCVVRQSAEDRAVGHLWSLKPLKDQHPARVIALMGCLVGVRPDPALSQRFPFVDVFLPPSDPAPLLAYLMAHPLDQSARLLDDELTAARYAMQDHTGPRPLGVALIDQGGLPFQRSEPDSFSSAPAGSAPRLQSIRHLSLAGQPPVAANVPVVYGCSHACTFCIIPYRRGVERSRPLEDVVSEARGLVTQGVREITLLGQIVDRYGKDFPAGRPDLADLLEAVDAIDGLSRRPFPHQPPSLHERSYPAGRSQAAQGLRADRGARAGRRRCGARADAAWLYAQ